MPYPESMKIPNASAHSTSTARSLALLVLPAVCLLAPVFPVSAAETTTTETTVTTTSTTDAPAPVTAAEIAAQERVLKEKILELDRAKLEQTKSEALEARKVALMVEIKNLELIKARRDLLVQETKDQLAMLLQGDVLFDTNSDVIKTGAHASLRQVALLLSEYPKGQVIVTGFADSTGTLQDNMALSRRRAESVKTYLLGQSESLVSSERVTARGMGEAQPVATTTTTAGRQLNRRVEITIRKPLAE